MKIRYLNGEKVYVDDFCWLDTGVKPDFLNDVQIVRHNDLVRALNAILKDAENNPDELSDVLTSLLRDFTCSRKGNYKIKVETFNKRGIQFDNPHKVKSSKPLALKQERRAKISEKRLSDSINDEVKGNPATQVSNIQKDIFVNLNLLFEKTGPIISSIDNAITRSDMWLQSEVLRADWLPDKAKEYTGYVRDDNRKASGLLKDLLCVFHDFKKSKNEKPTLNTFTERPRLEHMHVIKGGIFKPSETPATADDLLSDEFRKWQREQNNENANQEVTHE